MSMNTIPTLEEAWENILNDNDAAETDVINAIELNFNKAILSSMEPQEVAMMLAGKLSMEFSDCQESARKILLEYVPELENMKKEIDDGFVDRIEDLLMRVEDEMVCVIVSTTLNLSTITTEMQEKTSILIRKPEAYSFVANTYEYVTNHFLEFKKEMQDMLVSFGFEITDESFNSKIYGMIQVQEGMQNENKENK